MFIIVVACLVSAAHGFAGIKSSSADEAVAIFQAAYPKKEPYRAAPWASWGVPRKDFDGTKIKVAKPGEIGRRFSEIDPKQCRDCFTALANVYGEEQALEMTKTMPIILSFDRKCFEPSFQEWSAIFGRDETMAMVKRNPGLLAVRPEVAAASTDQTMNFSYIVAYTRPLSKILLPGLLFLLAVPSIETVTGVPIRAALAGLFN